VWGAGTVVQGSGNGSPVGSPAGSGVYFLFFNPLTEAGICKAPASVKRLTEAGKATVSVIHGLTVTFGRRRMLLPISDNEKRPPRLSLL
jgi:hypothetical protein